MEELAVHTQDLLSLPATAFDVLTLQVNIYLSALQDQGFGVQKGCQPCAPVNQPLDI